MKQQWSKWLGMDLANVVVTTESVSEIASRMHLLRHLKEGNKVLDGVNSIMKDMTGELDALVYTHPSVSYDSDASRAIDGLAANITEITDTGKWPSSWEGNSLKTMSLVMTAFATSLQTDFKSLVTILANAYSNSYGEEAMISEVKSAPAFAQQFIMGTVLSLNLTDLQVKSWQAGYDMKNSPGPHDVIRSFYALKKPAANDSPVSTLTP